MSVLESLNQTSTKAVDAGERFYVKTKAFYKLKVFHQLSLTIGILGKMAVIGGIAFLGFIFFIVALTLYLGEILESNILACLIVGGSLILVSMVAYLMRKHIDNLVVRKLSNKFLD